MRLTFYGGARTVTGSCYLLEAANRKILIDCGLFQGTKEIKERNYLPFPFKPAQIDCVILTHAHIDHSGLLPKLVKEGYRHKIYCTQATLDLCRIMLPDSAHIQEMENTWKNRKRSRNGLPELEPLYTVEDAGRCLKHFSGVTYHREVQPFAGVKFMFRDAGHILGSSIIELWYTEDGDTRKIVFSGDLGQTNQPIIRDPEIIESADYLVMESTYGSRLHEGRNEKKKKLQDLIIDSLNSGGNLIIPSFAVGRAQDLLYEIKILLSEGKIPALPVHIDSPMAVSATEIYRSHPECFDEPTFELLEKGESPFDFRNLHYVRSAEESMRLNTEAKRSIIISSSGMCEAGRIKHHLKHNLWRPQSRILFVGYQAEGTLGRRIKDGEKMVRIFGEDIAVKARVESIDGFSAHADRDGLLHWVKSFTRKPRHVFLVHGEDEGLNALAEEISNLSIPVSIPERFERYEIKGDEVASTEEEITAQKQTAAANEMDNILKLFEYRWLKFRERMGRTMNRIPSTQKRFLKQQLHEITENLIKLEESMEEQPEKKAKR